MPDQFRKAVRRIMTDGGATAAPVADKPPEKPESYGWLRTPEWDKAGGEAWELPDGEIRLVKRKRGRKSGVPGAGS